MTGDFIQRRDRAYRGASRMLTRHGSQCSAVVILPSVAAKCW
jgi:hypothetical protein